MGAGWVGVVWVVVVAIFATQIAGSFVLAAVRVLFGIRRCTLCQSWRRGCRGVALTARYQDMRATVNWTVCPACFKDRAEDAMQFLGEGLECAQWGAARRAVRRVREQTPEDWHAAATPGADGAAS